MLLRKYFHPIVVQICPQQFPHLKMMDHSERTSRGQHLHFLVFEATKHKCSLQKHSKLGLVKDFLIDGRRSQIWAARLGGQKEQFQYITLVPRKSLMHNDIQKVFSYHNFYLFFPICKRKEFKLFQLLESFKKKKC